MEDSQEPEQHLDSHQIALETPLTDVFRPPSIHKDDLLNGTSYSHYSPLPSTIAADTSIPCVLGVDEAGRGPVLGPMVYGVFYCPQSIEQDLLATTHHFDDSKVLTPATRSSLMQTLCTPSTDLHNQCGWATTLLSAQSISAGMLRATGAYNLNAQAVDATIDLIRGVLAQGVNVAELYVDTIGRPETYQKKLEALFPMMRVTVAKKADSLYPCVSAASVCAKVSRDAALEVCAEHIVQLRGMERLNDEEEGVVDWGSGYPSDARCVNWMKANVDPVFGWGNECRFSWGTVKELLEGKKQRAVRVDWAVVEEGDEDDMKMTSFLKARNDVDDDELVNWYGRRVGPEVF